MRKYVYVVAEMHNSPYLEEPHLFETEFATKKEALKAFSKTCRDAKEESAMASRIASRSTSLCKR